MGLHEYDTFDRVLRKLNRLAPLGEADLDALRSAPFDLKNATAECYLVREGQEATNCHVLLDGYACRAKKTRSGDRQIVSIHFPGDILNLNHVVLPQADFDLQTLTDATLAQAPLAAIRRIAETRSMLAMAFWRDTLVSASISCEWLLNVCRRNALSRIAHLLCEFAVRLEKAELGTPILFVLPMTQDQIADATGMTPVHVNRTLEKLAGNGAILLEGRDVRITDWNLLSEIAEFDTGYLHGTGCLVPVRPVTKRQAS